VKKRMLTAQRRAVYETLKECRTHPTAAELIDLLRERGYHFAYGTVYNSLRYLVESGMIRELKFRETASRYDAVTEDHPHLVCERCGRVEEVFADMPKEWLSRLTEHTGYRLRRLHVVVEGVCRECQRQETEGEGEGREATHV